MAKWFYSPNSYISSKSIILYYITYQDSNLYQNNWLFSTGKNHRFPSPYFSLEIKKLHEVGDMPTVTQPMTAGASKS